MSISNKLKDHILESIAEGVFTVDKNFRINYFNKAAEKITGKKRDNVLGKFCKHVFNSDQCFADCPIALVLKSQNNIYDFDSTIRHNEGYEMSIKLNAAVLYNEDSQPNGGIVTFRDMTEIEKYKKKLEAGAQYHGIIGQSREMKDIFDLVEEIANSDAPVLISGESGTGKEMIANAIHETSTRNNKPLIKINCSVFPENLLASELFGHVKGAFTDAIKDRTGRFELADGGTIFLDEVAEMPLQMQVQLLRVLQEGTFERIGESITRKVDTRIIAATNINIDEALKSGKFREDLYFRLGVIPIEIPPLRKRKSDIPHLIQHFLNKFNLLYNKTIPEIDGSAIDKLISYSYPGNIRELENIIEYAFVRTSNGSVIDQSKLPSNIKRSGTNNGYFVTAPTHNDEVEKITLKNALERHHWNKSRVAKELNIGRTTLWRKMKKYGFKTD